MRKKLFICLFMACSILIFSFNMYSKASSKDYTIINPFYNLEFYAEDYHLFNKGYYLIVGDGDMNNVEVSGSIEYYYNYGNVNSDEFKSKINVNQEYEEALDDLFESFYKRPTGDCDLSIFLRVDNYAKIYYTEGPGTILYCYGFEVPNETESQYHVIDFDAKLPPQSIEEKYSFSDNVSSFEELEVNMTSNYFTGAYPGYYEFYVEVKDKAGNVSTVKDYIYVHDFQAPTITSTIDHYNIEVNSTKLTSEDIFANLTIKDNVTTYNNMTKQVTDLYKSQYNVVGEYSISYKMTDTHGNSTTKLIRISVKDTTAPTISLKAGGNTIYTNRELSIEEIYNLLNIEDNYDDIEFEDVLITSTSDGLEGVEYNVTVSVTDSNNNHEEVTFKYYINDTTPPNITVRDTVYLEKGRKYTTEDLLAILRAAGLIDDDATSVSILSQELLSSNNFEDVYSLVYQQVLSDGTIKQNSITLRYQNSEVKNNNLPIFIISGAILLCGGILLIIKRKKKIHANR